MSDVDVLAFVEDPGAANLVLDLDAALAKHNLSLELWADGTARDYLSARNVEFLEVTGRLQRLNSDTARLLAIGTSETPEGSTFTLLAKARQLGVPTVGLIDSPANATERFRGTSNNSLKHLPDWLIVTDQTTALAFTNLNVSKNRIKLAANPALLRARLRGTKLAQGDRAGQRKRLFGKDTSPVIVFLSERSDGLNSADFSRTPDYTLVGRGTSNARTDIVFEALLDATATLAPTPRIVVCLHPKELLNKNAAAYNGSHHISTSSDPLELCETADLVVGMTTTLLSETHQMGQRVLSIVPRPEERKWLADLATDTIPCVWQTDAIAPTLERLLSTESRQPLPPEGSLLGDILAELTHDALRAHTTQTG